MFSYISRLAGFYHLPTVESLAVRKYRHGPGSWPVSHRNTKTHTHQDQNSSPWDDAISESTCIVLQQLPTAVVEGLYMLAWGNLRKARMHGAFLNSSGIALLKHLFGMRHPLQTHPSVFPKIAHIIQILQNTHYTLQVVRNCFCTWEWGLGWGDLRVVVTRSMVSLAGSQVPWIPCSCIRPLMSHYDLFSSSSFMATICQGWSVQVSSAKSTLSYTRQLPSEGGAIFMQSHLSTHYHRSGNVPVVRLARAKGLQSNCLSEVMWCSQWLVPLIGWNIWNICTNWMDCSVLSIQMGKLFFFNISIMSAFPGVWPKILLMKWCRYFSHQLHSRKPT